MFTKPAVGRSNRRRAFTLIEVLVVVAILGLLVAVLLPSLAQARYAGQRSVCLSNLNQLGKAIVTYAMENREYLPYLKHDGQPIIDKGPIRWGRGAGDYANYDVGSDNMSPIYPRYVRDLKLWMCPGARNVVKVRTDIFRTYDATGAERVGSAYEYNPFMFTRKFNPDPNGWPPVIIDPDGYVSLLRWSRLKRMSEVTLAHDSDDASLNVAPDDGDPHAQLKGGNMMYADGHARWVLARFWYEETDSGRPVVK